MRITLLAFIFLSSVLVKAQTSSSIRLIDSLQKGTHENNSHAIKSAWNKKWFFSTYSGISTGFNFFRGSNAMVVAAPLGLELNRKLNDNLYAFAGIAITPAYVNFNRSFLSSNVNMWNQNNDFFRSNSFGMYSRAELGLMYVNDARTFSISGSIGVQRSSNPIFNYQPLNAAKTKPVVPPNR
jgi:hypothetical protein